MSVDYGSKDEVALLKKMDLAKKLNNIMEQHGQLKKAMVSIVRLMYRNPRVPKLHNIRTCPSKKTYTYIKDSKWHTAPLDDFPQAMLENVQNLLRSVQRPLSYYMSSYDKIYMADPMRIMKHLDAFVNDDDGYGWDDPKMLTKKELIDALVAALSSRSANDKISASSEI